MRKLNIVGLSMIFALSIMGCDVKKHMEDIGLKQGENAVEKTTIKYDELIKLDQVCEEKWANIDTTLQRRSDLIPMLVETVKGYASHEQDTLRQVTEARASATQVKLTQDDLSDPAKVEAFNKAQAQIKGSFGRLMLIQEKYPELKADKHFHNLMTQMEGTENRILRARQEYNRAAGAYNTELLRVGGEAVNTIAGRHFKRREMFKADDAARTAPKVDFSKK
jgi:LemA protein